MKDKDIVQDIVDSKALPKVYKNNYLVDQYAGVTNTDEQKALISNALIEATRYMNASRVRSSQEAKDRIQEYFTHCIEDGRRPTVENLANCLGVTRQTLFEYEHGMNHTVEPDIITKAKEFIASFDAEMVSNGKLNPVTYIFRAKNYYGLKDQQDYIISPSQNSTQDRQTILDQADLLPDSTDEESK